MLEEPTIFLYVFFFGGINFAVRLFGSDIQILVCLAVFRLFYLSLPEACSQFLIGLADVSDILIVGHSPSLG